MATTRRPHAAAKDPHRYQTGFRRADEIDPDRDDHDHRPDSEDTGHLEATGIRLPYAPRPGQGRLATHAYEALRQGSHAVLEAGTGTGKTVAVLAAALRATAQDHRRVVWITRTNAQARQVLVELHAIQQDPAARAAAGGHVFAIAMQGRRHLCPQLAEDPRYEGADAEEYARLCGALKRATPTTNTHPAWRNMDDDPEHDETAPDRAAADRPTGGLPMAESGCPYYGGLLQSDPDQVAATIKAEPCDAQRLAAQLEQQGVCPYEAFKGLMPEARVIVAPYIYLAHPRLSKALQSWMQTPIQESLLVVDEAHNLADTLRDLHSAELSLESLDRARKEAHRHGDPVLAGGVTASRFVRLVKNAMEHVLAERLSPEQEDARVLRDDFTVPLLNSLQTTTPQLVAMISTLDEEGQRIRDQALRAGRLPRSHMAALARFLAAWLHATSAEHVPLAEHGPPPQLTLYCLDPRLGAGFLHDAHASVHISGTLRPLEQHRDLLGLGDATRMESLPSPYPREHLRLILVDDVTTRYDERNRDSAMMDRLAHHVRGFAEVDRVNSMMLFPSHALLKETAELALAALHRDTYRESPETKPRMLHHDLDAYRNHGRTIKQGGHGALWLGVTGGRISEGMDFPGPTLEAMCLVGVPYPKPSARQEALYAHNETRFGRGWEYTVEAPTLRRVLQSIGRVVRDHHDEGIVFLLDARYRRWAHELGRLERLGDDETIKEVLGDWLDRQRRQQDVAPRPHA